MRKIVAALVATTFLAGAVQAAEVYPLDRATILTGSPFDFKVEFASVVKPEDVKITVNGQDYKAALGKDAEFVAEEKNKDKVLGSAVILRGVTLASAGDYKVEVSAGSETKAITWTVYGTPAQAKAKNVIFLIADGLSVAHRTAARIMSKGMTEGKANGRLNMDDVPPVAFIGTSATDAVATDSANTMSAYMTGHKTAVNAIGVYADRTPASLDDPKVETIAEALRRQTKKSIGIISTAELQDATPAAVVAHTRKRGDKADINGMLFDVKPDVLLGGGSAYFLPQATAGSKRKDDKDYIALFKEAGYTLATSKAELATAAGTNTGKILGLFHTGNMDTALDREFLKKGTTAKFPDQPGLVEMTKVALGELSKNPDGFFLMVEAANVDKMSHPLDWDRAVVDTIEFDKAVGVAREFAAKNPDTLIVVTGDHTHGVSIIGTVDDDKPGTEMREKVGTYAEAGFPNYEDKDGDGYPDKVDVSRRLFLNANNGPDHYETFRPKLDGPFTPAVQNEKKEYVANEQYKDVPGAVFVPGIIPKSSDSGVHAVDDVVLQAEGPGAEGFRGYMEQSDVYKGLAEAFALGAKQTN
ncbi:MULTISPECIES: alkaline phosphatase [Agrobacterium]|jgi:alkaline phosphatase|uniref:Alkaline phosphatase n=1 Tax=Agrobacterium radiobacter TaxID=362 RepID=A0ABD5LSF7_AGRRD|nr:MULTISPECIES: alkaline phosphatase [Agrobacterium tumefaciens complex]MCP2136423.1 alkaline phosphatase [Rhizobium sp. SLBN-94]EPR08571.1 alkaline phosphatase [Agrobacterium radiobacter DSM 30147]KAB0454791.1 alkaline phosphatase [Agrobacterium tumefaciens]KWT78582.1 alkaline phosphatase [Agrobacterium radiobacter]MBP2535744.1 alkaline phosphatase [Agrobacterium tumefaciens]